MTRKKWLIITMAIVLLVVTIAVFYLIKANENETISVFKSNYNKFNSIIDYCAATDEWFSFNAYHVNNNVGANKSNPVIELHNNDTGQGSSVHAKDLEIRDEFLYIVNTLGFFAIYEDYYNISFYRNGDYSMEGVLFVKNKDALIQMEELTKQQGYYYSNIKGDWYYFHSANRKDKSKK